MVSGVITSTIVVVEEVVEVVAVVVSTNKRDFSGVGFLVDFSMAVWYGCIWPKNVNSRKGVVRQKNMETIIIMKTGQFLEHFFFLSVL